MSNNELSFSGRTPSSFTAGGYKTNSSIRTIVAYIDIPIIPENLLLFKIKIKMSFHDIRVSHHRRIVAAYRLRKPSALPTPCFVVFRYAKTIV